MNTYKKPLVMKFFVSVLPKTFIRGMHWFYAISFNNRLSNLFFKWSVISIFTIFVISREIALYIPLFISGVIH